ncbi:hypothetical protein PsorP6_003176 [Peronosclerospora sorghi]|uniref:Uncharacterized protein n=1 Tax=Peronosclerospora sorghi TaxID=230839 RepID=A0ACC0VMU9_9STRA|nr:hypothetical protein PsorP6_003176 [Peronosclerospora sorghi]
MGLTIFALEDVSNNIAIHSSATSRSPSWLKEAAEDMAEKMAEYTEMLFRFKNFVAAVLDPRIKTELLPADFCNNSNLRKLRTLFEAEYPAPLKSLVCSQEATTSTSTPADSGDNRQQSTSYLETLATKKRNQAAQTGPVDELQIYLSETVIHTSENPLKYWEHNQSRFTRLSRMARDYLAVQSTSVPTEQTFSQAGDVITKKRNRLDPSTVQAVECAAFWSEAGIPFRSKRREDILELAAQVNADEAERADFEFLEDDENNGEDDFDDII